MGHFKVFEASDPAGDGLVVDQVDGLTEFRVKFGRHRLAAILDREQRLELARELLRDFDKSPAPRLRALRGGAGR